ncbi:hypothetical protein ACJMK2_027002 [Sinanodonta woodiana]|uniref:Ig-like domain-containing protein n=1 Tax=Sinanodonta woodiana TaxID=1069815 RepID=A0ABD3XLH1_SINWO
MIHFAYLVLFFIASTTNSEGRIVQAIIGRRVSLSLTLITKDSIDIYHDRSWILTVWPDAHYILASQKKEKVRVYVDISTEGTIKVIIDLLNSTTSDAGVYTVKGQWDSKELNDSVVLRTIEESMIPRIYAAWHISEDLFIVMKCITSGLFAKTITWKRNSSLIRNQDRYYFGNDSLSIRNLTAGDEYTLYTCMDQERGLESDPFQIKASGPGGIEFTPKVTIAFDQDSLNISCNSDCSPVCKWQWTRTDPLSGLEQAVSGETVLKLYNITKLDAGRYSCKVQNILSGASFASYLTLDVNDPEYHMTTKTLQKDNAEASAFPSMHILTYFLSGFSILCVIGLCICLFKKIRECITVDRRELTLPEVDPKNSYWTIVSNTKGEMTTAVETHNMQINEPTAQCNKTVTEINEVEASSQLYTLDVDIEFDGYIHPISSNPLTSVFASSQLT